MKCGGGDGGGKGLFTPWRGITFEGCVLWPLQRDAAVAPGPELTIKLGVKDVMEPVVDVAPFRDATEE